MKKIYFLTVVLLLHFAVTRVYAQAAGLCCPYTGWDYVVPITISNNTGAAIPAQATLFVINTATPIGAGKMQSNGNDIRFVYNTCGNNLAYWIESGINTASTNIWIALPVIPNGGSITIYMYYGNASATAGASAQAVLFPSIITYAASQNLSGTINADWIDVNAGVTLTLSSGQPLILKARKVVMSGTIDGNNKGNGPMAGPGAGTNGNGSVGGGGGGYGGNGGTACGGFGPAYDTPNGGYLINMGSGGGAGGSGGSGCPATAAGGGMVVLDASVVQVTGSITVNGQQAANCNGSPSDEEAAGGGSGGGILLQGEYVTGAGGLTANGGRGGNSSTKEGGGGGAGGRVKIHYCNTNSYSGAISVTGASPGSGPQCTETAGAVGFTEQTQVLTCIAISVAPEQPVSIPTASFTYDNACTGVVTTFTSTSTLQSGGSVSTYAWDFGDGGTASTANPTHSFAATGTFNVQLTVTTATGCTDNVTTPVTVQQLPVADFTANTVCSGNATSFTNASTGGPLTYAWDFGDSNSDNVQNPQHTYTTGGNYNATLIVTNGGNCHDTIQKPVTVNQGALAAFQVSTVCYPGTTTFFNSSTGSIVNYGWSFGDGQVSSAAAPAHNYAAGNYTAILIVATANGCADTATQPVVVNPSPTADFNVAAVCEGTASTFTDASAGNGLTYDWDFGDGGTDATQNPSHLYATTGTYNATLIVTNSVSCADTIQKQAMVNPNPVAAFTTANVCFPVDAQFNNTSAGVVAQNGWSFGDGQISTQQNPSHAYASAGSYNVILIVATANNCADTATQNIVVNPHPIADFTVSPVCEGLTSTFADASSITGGNIIGYGWSFGDGNVSTQQSPTNTYATANSYNVVLIVQSDSSCFDTITRQAVVNPVPVVDFTTGAVCLNQNNAFVNTTTISSGSVSTWAWDFGDAQTSAQQGPTHIYSTQGTYTVSLVAVSDNN
jgi:PKD repeat protein